MAIVEPGVMIFELFVYGVVGSSRFLSLGLWISGFWFIVILVHRDFCIRAYGYRAFGLSGFWFIGIFAFGLMSIGHLVYPYYGSARFFKSGLWLSGFS